MRHRRIRRFAGVLTVEDLAEELVGEINDEHDPRDDESSATTEDGVWVINGETHIDEMERVIGRDLPRGDYETMAGLLIAELGKLPELGTELVVDLVAEGADFLEDEPRTRSVVIEVLEVDRHVPSRLRVELTPEPATEEDDAAPTADRDEERS